MRLHPRECSIAPGSIPRPRPFGVKNPMMHPTRPTGGYPPVDSRRSVESIGGSIESIDYITRGQIESFATLGPCAYQGGTSF